MRWAAALVWAAVCVVVGSTCAAQNLPPVGEEGTLDVATWNIEHFGNDSLEPEDETQIDNAATIIRQSNIDLWAIQEIEDENDFQTLVETVGEGWAGIVDQRSTNLHVGFLYNEDVIHVRNVTNILTDVSNVFAGRPPLQIEVDVTLPDTSFVMTFITLHMKAFGNSDAHAQRKAASGHLKNYVDYTTLNTRPVVILGDLNDELLTSITPGLASPYANFLADSSNYFFSTLDLDLAGANTFCFSARCSSGSTIDHILITNELFAASGKRSAEIYDSVFDAYTFYTSTTSDHLPVYARFAFKTNTNIEAMPLDRPPTLYPNPARGGGTLEYEAPAAGDVSIHLYDLLGRELRSWTEGFLSAGRHRFALNAADLAPGRYIIRLQTGGQSYVKSFFVVR